MLYRKKWMLAGFAAVGQAVDISVSSTAAKPASPYQYGIMFEDINYCGDGGIYAELIRNRAFQATPGYPANLTGWSALGNAALSIKTLSNPLSVQLPTSMNVATNTTAGRVGFANSGYWGIHVKIQPYTGSFYVKGDFKGTFRASLRARSGGDELGSVEILSSSRLDTWTQHNFTFTPTKAGADVNNSFEITFEAGDMGGHSLDFNLISLFPPTYKNRPNGLRPDLIKVLTDLKPTFLRFPGGSDVEGTSWDTRWKWNETLGPLRNRPGRRSIWGYQETGGLGLVEYLEWCEDLNLEPVFAVWSGLSLNNLHVSEAQLQPYIQEALDAIEFIVGSTNTTYGALRASLGHPNPWRLKYVEVGNEDSLNDGLASYSSYRLPAFQKAINSKYPDILVMSSTNDAAVKFAPPLTADYHDYDIPDHFVKKFTLFDNTVHPTLLGELAVVYLNNPNGTTPWSTRESSFPPTPWWIGSVAEAILLLGAERNTGLDKIIGSTYAPTFLNVNSYQWSPTLVAFSADPSKTTRSTSHHVWSLFSNNVFTQLLTTSSNSSFGPLYYSAGLNETSGSLIFKAAVYNSTTDVPVTVSFEGFQHEKQAVVTILTAGDPFATNVYSGHDVVRTNETTIMAGSDGKFSFQMPALSVAVLKTQKTSPFETR